MPADRPMNAAIREKKRKAEQRKVYIFFICFLLLILIIGGILGFLIGNLLDASAAPAYAEESYQYQEDSGQAKQLKSIGTYTITAYCPCRKCCGKWANGITASGVYAKSKHTIAAPKGIPFGTVLVIDGIEYTVEDRGGAIRGKKLDIYFDTHREALNWGRQKREVFIYE